MSAALLAAVAPGHALAQPADGAADQTEAPAAAVDRAGQLGNVLRQPGVLRTPAPGFQGNAIQRARQLVDALATPGNPQTPEPPTPTPPAPTPGPVCQASFGAACDPSADEPCCVDEFPGVPCITNAVSPAQSICTDVIGEPTCQFQLGAPCDIGGYVGCCDPSAICQNGRCAVP